MLFKVSELKVIVSTGSTIEITQAQLITILLLASLITYTTSKIKYLRVFSWLGFSLMGLAGLISSGWNIWMLVEHLSSPKLFIDALNVCNTIFKAPSMHSEAYRKKKETFLHIPPVLALAIDLWPFMSKLFPVLRSFTFL